MTHTTIAKDYAGFVAELKVKQPHLEAVSTVYRGSRSTFTVKCLKCGFSWYKHAGDFVNTRAVARGHPCVECRSKDRGYEKIPKKSHSKFLSNLLKVTTTIKPLDPYTGVKDHIRWTCTVCDHVWKSTPDNILHRHPKCPQCSKPDVHHNTASKSEIAARLAQVPNLKALYTPTQMGELGLFQCLVCKHKFKSSPSHVYTCAVCSRIESKYQRKNVRIAGRKFNIQGYEPQAIRWILKSKRASVDQIIVGVGVPRFTYGLNRMYMPDMYIENQNRIVEVKSSYTAAGNPNLYYNLLQKRKAVVSSGFKYSMLVFDAKGSRIELPNNWHSKNYFEIRSLLGLNPV